MTPAQGDVDTFFEKLPVDRLVARRIAVRDEYQGRAPRALLTSCDTRT